jgi:hypothetical protein
MLPIIEIAFGAYMSCFIVFSLVWQYAVSSVPFLCIFAGGYLYVGFSSLYVLWKMHQESNIEVLAPVVDVIDPASLL